MTRLEAKALQDVVREMRAKESLEQSLLPRIRTHLDRIALAFRRSFATSGMMPNLTGNRERLALLLAEHHRRTSKHFSGVVLAQLGAFHEGAEALRDLAIARWIDQRSPLQAFAIVTTSERRMPRAVAQATRTLAEEQKPITSAAIAATAANLLRLDGRKRAPAIASFETQIAAETTKRIEAEAISGRLPFSLSGDAGLTPPVADPIAVAAKSWQTEENETVRPAHVLANQQIVPIDDPFIVGGETLFFPGDTSRGASLSNVIGCRCASIYRAGVSQ